MASAGLRWTNLGWGVGAAVALMWPGHGLGLVDGLPFDGHIEAALIGLLFPTLWWLHPQFFGRRAVRVLILVLTAAKLADVTLVTQQGWCGRFAAPTPLVSGGPLVQQAWDLRTDWDREPTCSAIVARPYLSFTRFPVWFLNLQDTRPPNLTVRMTIDGYLAPSRSGTLSVDVAGSRWLHGRVGSTPVSAGPETGFSVDVPPGSVPMTLDVEFEGSQWRFVPAWEGTNVFTSVLTSVVPPGRVTILSWHWLSPLISLLAILLVSWWAALTIVELRPTLAIAAWAVTSSLVCMAVGATDSAWAARSIVPLLAGSLLVLIPRRLRTLRGAFMLVGLPWLVLIATGSFSHIGRISLYNFGDDPLIFQRYAHRIFIQGYWLEGGQETFWFQPLYRWIAGALHLVFGDASVGEAFLDAAAILVGALFAFYVVKRNAGFQWGLAAAVGTLATVAIAPTWYIIGRGLSEIVSAGFAYLAAFCLLRGRHGAYWAMIGAVVLAMLAFYARLNNLPFVAALLVMALSLKRRAGDVWRPSVLWRDLRIGSAAAVVCAVGLALLLLAWRTWYYTGEFSPFYGTQREHLSTFQPTSAATVRRMAESVVAVLTLQDPPRLDPRAAPLVGGVFVALLGLLGVPRLRNVPLALSVLFLSGLAGAFVAHGTAYVGRFSVHLIPVGVALVMCAMAQVLSDRPADAPELTGKWRSLRRVS